MPGPRNIKDHFEEIYLRYNTAKKNLKNADINKIKDVGVKKCIMLITNKYYATNKIFLYNGYDFEDLHSIITFFALVFFGFNNTFNSEHHQNTVLMRYLDQRIVEFIKLIKRKFHTDEMVSFSSQDIEMSFEDIPNTVYNDDEITLPEQIEILSEKALSKTTNIDEIKKIEKQIKQIKTKIYQNRKEERKLSKLLKETLENDIDNYKELLIYYASSKYIAIDIRKAARKYCKKFEIDYKGLLPDLIKKNNYDIIDFLV